MTQSLWTSHDDTQTLLLDENSVPGNGPLLLHLSKHMFCVISLVSQRQALEFPFSRVGCLLAEIITPASSFADEEQRG